MTQKKINVWVDPLGRKIVLELDCWNRHILRNHPDMAFRKEDVSKTIVEPEVIKKQGEDRLYYKSSADFSNNKYMKVVCKI